MLVYETPVKVMNAGVLPATALFYVTFRQSEFWDSTSRTGMPLV